MLAALSPEAQVNKILDDIGRAVSNYSEIADRHANSRIIQWLKGVNDFVDPTDSQYYLDLARQMKRLAEEYPVPISWKETQRIKQILAARKTTAQPVPFTVVLVGPLLFKQLSSGQMETTTSYQECCAFENGLVAIDAARLLDRMGHGGVRIVTVTNMRRDPATFISKLADVGFESTAVKQ